MKTGTLTWNNKNSLTDLGVYVSGSGTHNAAEEDVTVFSIPGRNGDLVVPNNRFRNIQVLYPAFVPHSFALKEQGIRNWLRKTPQYMKLTDTYDPTHYRMARPSGELDFEPVRGDAANFQIVFDCMPQRWLTSGDTATSISGSATLSNPTDFPARPLMSIKNVGNGLEVEFAASGSGTVVTFTAGTSYTGTVMIDCETQDVYDTNGVDKNDLFTVSGEFPVLEPGANTVTLTGTYTSAEIKPRWWEL